MLSLTQIEKAIETAFYGVRLGDGISLRQAQKIDDYNHVVDAEYNRLPSTEITNDWTKVPISELDRNCVAHLDSEGYRYYIPAFMLSVLKNYEPSSMRVIGTLLSLYPKAKSLEYNYGQYEKLSDSQKSAIAHFLEVLPVIVALDHEGQTTVERALRNYWHRFL